MRTSSPPHTPLCNLLLVRRCLLFLASHWDAPLPHSFSLNSASLLLHRSTSLSCPPHNRPSESLCQVSRATRARQTTRLTRGSIRLSDSGKPECRDWQFGRCHRGDMCRYAHVGPGGGGGGGYDRDRGYDAPRRDPGACFDFVKGRCFRRDCKFTHDASAQVEVRPSERGSCQRHGAEHVISHVDARLLGGTRVVERVLAWGWPVACAVQCGARAVGGRAAV